MTNDQHERLAAILLEAHKIVVDDANSAAHRETSNIKARLQMVDEHLSIAQGIADPETIGKIKDARDIIGSMVK